ncbi:MAG: ribonuclease HI, partial [Bacteroidales bacterium]|nr:ribonuclease HI [Bacteroidales bacterium]
WLQKWLLKGLEKQKNPDLWERFLKVYRKHRVSFFWIKGHAGHPENERCDKLAVEAALSSELLVDAGYKE